MIYHIIQAFFCVILAVGIIAFAIAHAPEFTLAGWITLGAFAGASIYLIVISIIEAKEDSI